MRNPDDHRDHPWRKIGRCVYCGPCGVRLYHGELPEGQPVYTFKRTAKNDPATKMLERFGKI